MGDTGGKTKCFLMSPELELIKSTELNSGEGPEIAGHLAMALVALHSHCRLMSWS